MIPLLTEDQRALVATALTVTQSRLRAADNEQINAAIASLDVLPAQRLTDDRASFHVAIYAKAIESEAVPLWALEAAILDFLCGRANSKWRPSPPELIAQCQRHTARVRWAHLVYSTLLDPPSWMKVQQPVVEEDMTVNPLEVEHANAIMKRFNLKPRYTKEGWLYWLIPGAGDEPL